MSDRKYGTLKISCCMDCPFISKETISEYETEKSCTHPKNSSKTIFDNFKMQDWCEVIQMYPEDDEKVKPVIVAINPNTELAKQIQKDNPHTLFVFDDVNYGIIEISSSKNPSTHDVLMGLVNSYNGLVEATQQFLDQIYSGWDKKLKQTVKYNCKKTNEPLEAFKIVLKKYHGIIL